MSDFFPIVFFFMHGSILVYFLPVFEIKTSIYIAYEAMDSFGLGTRILFYNFIFEGV